MVCYLKRSIEGQLRQPTIPPVAVAVLETLVDPPPAAVAALETPFEPRSYMR